METSLVRRRIVDVITARRHDAAERRKRNAEALPEYDGFLERIAIPVARQVADVLRAERLPFRVQTPADAVRLVSDRAVGDFLEISLDTSGQRPQVVVHVEHVRGREQFVDVQSIRPGVLISALTEEDVLEAIADALGPLVER
jgi:hypothetical protein